MNSWFLSPQPGVARRDAGDCDTRRSSMMSGRRRGRKSQRSWMYSSTVKRWKSEGRSAYSAAIRVPRMSWSWCIFSVVMGSEERISASRRSMSRLSPGSPRMMCAPTDMPRLTVRRMASTVCWWVCPRRMRRRVSLYTDSMPYSTMTVCSRLSSASRSSTSSLTQSGRVPMTMPSTSGTESASRYLPRSSGRGA